MRGDRVDATRPLGVRLEAPAAKHEADFLAAVRRSRRLHSPWVSPPRTPEAYRAYLERLHRESHLGYLLRVGDSGDLAGVVNVNGIVRGALRSGYLGYYAFRGFERRGVLTEGLRRVVTRVFREHGLHRLEANIQPSNEPSLRLVRRLGFRREGFSRRYLKVAGRWRDHERWAVIAEDWRSART